MANTLYYGDNLHILRRYIPAESVDLIYLDPPFNSERAYSVLFKDDDVTESAAQVRAFDDFWRWDEVTQAHYDELTAPDAATPEGLSVLLPALRAFLHDSNMMAYIVMMSVRLVELHRALKPTGTLYLHCDPTAAHYLKLSLDAIFGSERFLNEIAWKRTHSHGNVGRNFGAVLDVILVYTKGSKYTWRQQYTPVSEKYVASKYSYSDSNGRRWQSVTLRNPSPRPNLHYPYKASNGVTYPPHPNGWSCDRERMQRYDREGRLHFPTKDGGQLRLKMYLDESPGVKLQNLWDDIPPVNSQADEGLGYPTQKPVALLERILATSSNEGDVVLDPFCGCGTTIAAAHRLNRAWIGIDITHLAISIIRRRLDALSAAPIVVRGEPADVAGAKELAKSDPYQFQWWALDRIGARPSGSFVGREGKKGGDRGIDGVIRFRDEKDGPPQRAIVQVKGGHHVAPSMIRDLRGTMEREGATIGVFLTLQEPTDEMRREARLAGTWWSKGWERNYPRIQILTVAQVFEGERVKFPGQDVTLRAVPRPPKAEPEQLPLLDRASAPKKRHGLVRATKAHEALPEAPARKAR